MESLHRSVQCEVANSSLPSQQSQMPSLTIDVGTLPCCPLQVNRAVVVLHALPGHLITPILTVTVVVVDLRTGDDLPTQSTDELPCAPTVGRPVR